MGRSFRNEPKSHTATGAIPGVSDIMSGFGGLGEALQKLFAQIANFNLDSSTMNFHW